MTDPTLRSELDRYNALRETLKAHQTSVTPHQWANAENQSIMIKKAIEDYQDPQLAWRLVNGFKELVQALVPSGTTVEPAPAPQSPPRPTPPVPAHLADPQPVSIPAPASPSTPSDPPNPTPVPAPAPAPADDEPAPAWFTKGMQDFSSFLAKDPNGQPTEAASKIEMREVQNAMRDHHNRLTRAEIEIKKGSPARQFNWLAGAIAAVVTLVMVTAWLMSEKQSPPYALAIGCGVALVIGAITGGIAAGWNPGPKKAAGTTPAA